MRIILLVLNFLLALIGSICAIFATYYLASSENFESDKLNSLAVLATVAVGLAAVAIGNLLAIRRGIIRVRLFIMNSAIILIAVVLFIAEYRSGSLDTSIWMLLVMMLILNLVMLIRLRSVSRAICDDGSQRH